MNRPRKVNTRLKVLAEARARATATTEKLGSRLVALAAQIAKTKAQLVRLQEINVNLGNQLIHFHNKVRAIDKLISLEFPSVEPEKIPPTYGYRSEYGRRGALVQAIREVVRESGAQGVSMKELGLAITKKLGLVHHTQDDFRVWAKSSLEPALRRLRHNKGELGTISSPGLHPRWILVKQPATWEELMHLEHEVK